jgi:hypothetical protein
MLKPKREYNLKYLGKIGNVFHTKDIEAAIDKGRKYNPDNFNPYYFTSVYFHIIITMLYDNNNSLANVKP